MIKLYAVVDKKAKQIVCTFCAVNDEFAKRSFEMLLTKPEEDVYNLFHDQFALMYVGELSYDGVLRFQGPGNYDITIVDYLSDGDEFSDSYIQKQRELRYKFFAFIHEHQKELEEQAENIKQMVGDRES